MPALTQREKRTVRFAAVAIAIYLVLFFGMQGWKRLEASRAEYQKLVQDAQKLRQEVQPYENKALLAEKLKGNFHIDLSTLAKTSLVAQASAAIQQAAQAGGVQLGPIRESAARTSSKELVSMQLEGFGPVPAVTALLHRLEVLGYPLILDSVQVSSDPTKPNMVKLSLTIVILDFDQWKNEEKRNA